MGSLVSDWFVDQDTVLVLGDARYAVAEGIMLETAAVAAPPAGVRPLVPVTILTGIVIEAANNHTVQV